MIVQDARNPRAVAIAQKLQALSIPDDLIVVVGGDGFLLQTVAGLGLDRPYLGINGGNLGFLLNDVDEWDVVAEKINRGAWAVQAFPLLEAHITLDDGKTVTERALNDVYLERMTGQTARLTLFFDGHKVVDPLVADGVIFATALGSTAYNYSAGGPACHPTLQVLSVTPICPHLPRLSPVALPAASRARVQVRRPEHRPVRAVADGREVNHISAVEVGYGSEVVQLAYLEGHDFTARMVRKLLHPSRPVNAR